MNGFTAVPLPILESRHLTQGLEPVLGELGLTSVTPGLDFVDFFLCHLDVSKSFFKLRDRKFGNQLPKRIDRSLSRNKIGIDLGVAKPL